MKSLFIIGAALLLAACATTETTQADADAHAACRNTDAPIGSNVRRRADCGAASSPEASEQAKRDAEALQRSQVIRQTGPGYGSGR